MAHCTKQKLLSPDVEAYERDLASDLTTPQRGPRPRGGRDGASEERGQQASRKQPLAAVHRHPTVAQLISTFFTARSRALLLLAQ